MNKLPDMSVIAAYNNKGVIGKDGDIPWHYPEDLKRFKGKTEESVVIMGRKTFESIGRPLPDRLNIVVSTTLEDVEGVHITRSIEEAVDDALEFAGKEDWNEEIFFIGGERVYIEGIRRANKMYLTFVYNYDDGDRYFPIWDYGNWNIVSESESGDLDWVDLERKPDTYNEDDIIKTDQMPIKPNSFSEGRIQWESIKNS